MFHISIVNLLRRNSIKILLKLEFHTLTELIKIVLPAYIIDFRAFLKFHDRFSEKYIAFQKHALINRHPQFHFH